MRRALLSEGGIAPSGVDEDSSADGQRVYGIDDKVGSSVHVGCASVDGQAYIRCCAHESDLVQGERSKRLVEGDCVAC